MDSRKGSTVSTETTWQDKLIVAAIDFGTTFSGFVLSFLKDYRQDKTSHILSHEWCSGEAGRTAKTPTAVLLKPDTSLDSFGYEAENRFLSATIEDDDDDDDDDEQSEHSNNVDPETWYFFRHFKMKLYGDKLHKPITLDSKIPDEKGRELPAILVFSRAIAYMKVKIFEVVSERFPNVREDDIYYVLTCPAIWSETSKQFMSDAAEKAGIPYDHLRIALEPECAAVYMLTKEVPSLSSSLRERFPMNEGDCYIVADLGGGTLDIAAHKINENRKYDEIMRPAGGPCGGNNINYKFEQFLISVSGAQAFLDFKEKHSQDYLYLMRNFEHKKYGFPGDAGKARVTMRMPSSFVDCHTEENHESFQDSIRQTSFSESVILVIIPAEANVAIMKGAVIYGRDERLIETRISKYSFGLDWNENFDPKVHLSLEL